MLATDAPPDDRVPCLAVERGAPGWEPSTAHLSCALTAELREGSPKGPWRVQCSCRLREALIHQHTQCPLGTLVWLPALALGTVGAHLSQALQVPPHCCPAAQCTGRDSLSLAV